MQYFKGHDTIIGGFDYSLTFNWYLLSQREEIRRNYDNSAPFRTPTIAGGLFTVERKYFYEIGSYDEGYF